MHAPDFTCWITVGIRTVSEMTTASSWNHLDHACPDEISSSSNSYICVLMEFIIVFTNLRICIQQSIYLKHDCLDCFIPADLAVKCVLLKEACKTSLTQLCRLGHLLNIWSVPLFTQSFGFHLLNPNATVDLPCPLWTCLWVLPFLGVDWHEDEALLVAALTSSVSSSSSSTSSSSWELPKYTMLLGSAGEPGGVKRRGINTGLSLHPFQNALQVESESCLVGSNSL